MAKFNASQFRREADKTIKYSKPLAYKLASEEFENNKREMLKQFNEHPVTQEIEAGPSAENISNTLEGKGNLFSFIGFTSDSKPTEVVKDILFNETIMHRTPAVRRTGSSVVISFTAKAPTLEDVEKETPMEWESGRSWVRGIERGISGFGNYIYWKFFSKPTVSRSGTGTQAAAKIRAGGFKNVPYLSRILSTFRESFRKRK
jgi:hypothetical protein